MRNLKSSRLYRREAAALAHVIDRRKLARHLRKALATQDLEMRPAEERLAVSWIMSAFIWSKSPQGFNFWNSLDCQRGVRL